MSIINWVWKDGVVKDTTVDTRIRIDRAILLTKEKIKQEAIKELIDALIKDRFSYRTVRNIKDLIEELRGK